MSEKKPTVAANAAKIEEVTAKVEERAAVVDAALAAKVEKIDAILAEIEVLKSENKRLETALASRATANVANIADETDGGEVIVELVAVPPEGVIMSDSLKYKGKKYKGERKDGFTHYRVPSSYAGILLTDKSTGVVWYLTGQTSPLHIKRNVGKRSKNVTVTPRVLDRLTNGEIVWKEVVEE